jgi:hypothetical protein
MSYFAKKCSNCKNYEGNIRICESCAHYAHPITVFEYIAASPEKMAEKLVYQVIGYDRHGLSESYYKSTITDESYSNKTEAIVATVARLKEAYYE